MTSTVRQDYNPVAQGFPDGYDRADSEYQVAERLRPHYRRDADLDRQRITALRAIQHEPFVIPDRLWPPGGGIPPPVQPAASAGRGAEELLAHYCALRDADAERRAEADAASADADRTARICSCCGSTDFPVWARSGRLDVLEPAFGTGPRLCEPCAVVIRRAARALIELDTDRIELEDTPAGPRGQACERWLAAALGEDG